MGRKYQVISGDGHLETPPDFVAFLPEKYKDRAPKLITLPDGGGDAWLMEGMPLTYASQNLRGRGKVKFAGQSYFKDDGSRTDGAGDGAPASPRAGRGRHRRRAALRARCSPAGSSRRSPTTTRTWRWCRPTTTGSPSYCSIAPDRLIGNALDARLRHRRRRRRARARARDWASSRCSCSTAPTAATRPKPEDDRFWEKALELEMPLSPHMSFGGVMNTGGPRHDTAQWPVEAGMTQHSQTRAGTHDGAAHRERHLRAVPRAAVLLRRDQRRDLPGVALLHGPRLPRVQQLVRARAPEDAVAVHEGPRDSTAWCASRWR